VHILVFLFWYAVVGPAVAFYNVPSGSMLETLQVGEVFSVSEDAYLTPHGSDPDVAEHDPRRGDVAVFHMAKDASVAYVKRVIGLPGDRVQMVDGVLVINGEPVERELLPDDPGLGLPTGAHGYAETLPNGRRYEILDLEPDGFVDNTPVFDVPTGQYFVLGDNRDNSTDSRINTFGFVPRSGFIGKAETIILSWSMDTGAMRWKRLFRHVQ
jgi:signal peptidase I